MGRTRILILGGTTEARLLAETLAKRDGIDVLLSLAGRTKDPLPQNAPVRTGGFGGSEGLCAFLKAEAIDLVVDATHPFATQISANAATAATITGTPIFALSREAWQRVAGDHWHEVADVTAALSALGPIPRRVFLAVGRQEAHRADLFPQHFYLVRSVDPVDPPLLAPDVVSILERGPFDLHAELRLMKLHLIDCVIAKNSGGSATYAKIEAARLLGIPVLMIARSAATNVASVFSLEAALARIDHFVSVEAKRGV
ncbi:MULTISPECIES: cobalt-precorrin-6A reductase [Rhizobium]|uniref:Cobalt-precorrin-6A reductase n=1 Tax=Rhizobium rhododendri TaxID=2506430 RepID=A0ABY8IGX4_9HYPH|nr:MULTISPECIES: cobalt-precorrin-6A reductase [Rhizobium]MBZ5759710.1 cobalt-precorrin-6A reductase [Rhizobium sp. VS19-DR96]MBZ5766098.1 cobalt-precorrin-6A reductase [Rhizobium sp. VS19-DR129.2]MBZ5772881.1 cobalt-precorrin-6A reductase [Rhizobium sp. VS19-DRK62.2]MBZ5786621.1 cobalt-precorrin-6A reductase [Rhizobium sp. VS19-DR121]MBZ5804355.1 cobalt-precorrin-6A reductase [Rhizobium sp. VS19-DR181]